MSGRYRNHRCFAHGASYQPARKEEQESKGIRKEKEAQVQRTWVNTSFFFLDRFPSDIDLTHFRASREVARI